MKEIKIAFLELHEPIFIGAKNYPPKIDATRGGIMITRYINAPRDEIHIVVGGVGTAVPFATVKQARPFDPAEGDINMTGVAASMPVNPPVPQGKIRAQVSAPNGIKID